MGKVCKYYIVTCMEIDILDGTIIHLNEKAKDINSVVGIIENNIDKYPNGIWLLCQNQITI